MEPQNMMTDAAETALELQRVYGISEPIRLKYEEFGITTLFDWQIDCLNFMKNDPTRNFVYSAPTSSGKTLIAEYLCIRSILKDRKKALFILPFISVTNEKMIYYQKLLGSSSGVVVEGFMGSHGSFPSLTSVNFAICTIEKANGLINRLIEEGTLDLFGTVVIDELHMLSEGSRGVILELILTKFKYMATKGVKIQIVGMSATLPNLKELADWLNAELYVTDFRPIPLKEHYIYGDEIYDIAHNLQKKLNSNSEFDQICQLCLQTIAEGCSILIFCHTKNQCENLAKKIATQFRRLGCDESSEFGQMLRNEISAEKIIEVLSHLKSNVCGFDANLLTPVAYGVAYHHAGLTMNEREILENAFRQCSIRVLVATTTLSSGVNLPARRVIIRSFIAFNRNPIEIMTYRQMIGRAGRMGKDTMGESYIMIKADEKNYLKSYFSNENQMKVIKSALLATRGSEVRLFSRIVLEAVGNETVKNLDELETFLKCTFAEFDAEIMFKTLNLLCNCQFIQKIKSNTDGRWELLTTAFGKACMASTLDPFYAIDIYNELDRARKCLALDTDLHMIYLLVPISSLYSFDNCNENESRIDWVLYKQLYRELLESQLRVAKLVGLNGIVLDQLISNERKVLRSTTGPDLVKNYKRFLVALALQDLVNEMPLNKVAEKFNCGRGALQTLQNSASLFAGMTQIFCAKLRWKNMEILIKQFEDRFMFGVEQELLELLKLPVMNAFRARVLYNNGIETIMDIIKSDVMSLAKIISDSVPFEVNANVSKANRNHRKDKSRLKFLWIDCYDQDQDRINNSIVFDDHLIEHYIAESLIKIAKEFQQHEIGCVDINWDKKSSVQSVPFSQAKMMSVSDCFDNSDVSGYKGEFSHELSKITDVRNKTLEAEPKAHELHVMSKAVSVPPKNRQLLKRRRILESTPLKRHKTASDCSFKTEVKNLESDYLSDNIGDNSHSELVSFSQPLFEDSSFDESKLFDESLFFKDVSFVRNSTLLNASQSIQSKCDVIEVVNVCDNLQYFQTFREKLCSMNEQFNCSLSSCFLSQDQIVFSISMPDQCNRFVAYLLQPTKFVSADNILNLIKSMLNKRNFKINCFDCKSFVCQWEFKTECDFDDPKVAAWLLKPDHKEENLSSVCETYAVDMMEFVKQIRKSNERDIIAKSCCIQSVVVQHLMHNLHQLLSEQQALLTVFRQEMDFMKTLICLEQRGVNVDVKLLKKIREVVKSLIKNCNEKAHQLNGHPIELGRKKLIEKIIRTRQKRNMLRNLSKEQDPIEILGQEYRSLNSMLIKVINPLLYRTSEKSGRVCGYYSIYTKTGRVVIVEPSLQTVPKNLSILLPETIDAVGHDKKKTNICLRSVFVPHDNFVFISADFCQLELRLLAHFSQDVDLCGIFSDKDCDAFVNFAAKWFKIDQTKVTDDLRQKSKQLCYAILYGMGVESLSKKLVQSKEEANSFLNQFRQQFPGLQKFIEDSKLKCRANKYLTTICGRKQYLPHIDHANKVIRSYAERQAVNNLIQGSAADIVKVATIKVDEMLRKKFANLGVLVLHIHDELLFEVDVERYVEIAQVIKTELEGAYRLDSDILLPVKLKMGKSWADLKAF